MSIITCLSAMLLIAATGQSPADSPSAQSTELEIKNVLRSRAAHQLAGVLTFEKQFPYHSRKIGGEKGGTVSQQWSISFDGDDRIRARYVEAQKDSSDPPASITMFGRTPERSWLLSGHELLVIHNDAPIDEEVQVRHQVLRLLIRQVSHEIDRALGAPALDEAFEIKMVDRDADNPAAIVEIGGRTAQFEFERRTDLLLLRRSIGSDRSATYRFNYSGFRYLREIGRWIPSTYEGYRYHDGDPSEPTLSVRYSGIQFTPASASGAQLSNETLDVPKPGDPDVPLVVVVTTVSDEGISYSTFDGLPIAKAE